MRVLVDGTEHVLQHDSPIATVHVAMSYQYCQDILQEFHQSTVLALDAEWVTHSDLRVALIQLSDGHTNVIVHVRAMLEEIQQHGLPSRLKEIIEDPSVYKVGVSIEQDILRMKQAFGVDFVGTLDLRCAQLKMFMNGLLGDAEEENLPKGLTHMAQHYLDVTITKDHDIRCGNWEAMPLSDLQIVYGAGDAYYSKAIFDAMSSSLEDPCSFFSDVLELRPCDLIKIYRPPKPKQKPPPRSKSYYHNNVMQAPDGTVMCIIADKQAEWYLKNDLADLVCEEPRTIRLKFQPKGMAHANEDFYLEERKDHCAACGNDAEFVKFHVVPSCYRKHFGKQHSGISAHDVVLLCPSCKGKCNQPYKELQKAVGIEYGHPLNYHPEHLKSGMRLFQRAKAAARELQNSGLSEDTKEDRYGRIQEYLDEFCDGVSAESQDLKKIVKMKLPERLKIIGHGEAIVNALLEDPELAQERLVEFARRWRHLFVETLNPQFLPPTWSVNHDVVVD